MFLFIAMRSIKANYSRCIVLFYVALVMSQNLSAEMINIDGVPSEDDLLSEADALFEANLFDKAICAYQLILQDIHNESILTLAEEYINLKLAQAYLAERRNAEALILLSQSSQENSPETKAAKLYLLGIAYKNLSNYGKAANFFGKCLHCKIKPSCSFYEHAQYELGLSYFLNHEVIKARECFELFSQDDENQSLYYLSRIYLARINLLAGNYYKSSALLLSLEQCLPKHHLLQYELAYWLGETFYQLKDYEKASFNYEKAIPKRNLEYASWYKDTLYQLGWSYLKMAENPKYTQNFRDSYFEKAETVFGKLLKIQASEKVYLALAQLYMTFSKIKEDAPSLNKAEAILTNADLFISQEAQAKVLLLRAESSPSYELRNLFYKKVTDEAFSEISVYSYAWYGRGLNDFKEGVRLLENKNSLEAANKFEVAIYAFKQAFNLLKTHDKLNAGLALKYQAEAYHYSNTCENQHKAYSLLDHLIHQFPDILQALEDPSEIYYLHGVAAAQLATWQLGDKFSESAELSLKQIIENYPNSSFVAKSSYLLGSVLYQKNNYANAEAAFSKAINELPESDLKGNAYFWMAKCLDKQKEKVDKAKDYKRKAFEEYPSSVYAAEAYFTYYNYRDYIQGNRAAMKHLFEFEQKFPKSPFLITANYLIGMDYKRDRKTPEGKWIRKKNMIEAIESFQKAETVFDNFYEDEPLSQEELQYFINLRYHSTLERALANLAIAEESQGAKKRIFLEYSEEVFKQMMLDLQDPAHPMTKKIIHREPYPKLLEESMYWLAQTYSKSQNDSAAYKVLSAMLENYKSVKITRGYFLSRARYDLGMIEMRNQKHSHALQHFAKSEDAAKGKILSVDQKIDLWIQQSLCHRELKEFDKAMLLLSKAINDDAISNLRIKAMYLRAEIYSLQARHELARKQLEAASKNGGEWALKAKQKLDEQYGYQ
jgi:tetratricopeptide (TPR) repeat protein